MSLRETKKALRREIVARILELAPDERARQEAGLLRRFAELPGLDSAERVLLYVRAFPEEIDTAPMLRFALERGQTLICPRVDKAERRLRLYEVSDLDADLEPGVLGIREPKRTCPEAAPETVDWMLAPGLGFDRRGYRLGRGAGHYDRLLPLLRPEVPRWGLLLTPQWVDDLPVEPHDQALDGVADHRGIVVTDARRELT